MKCPVLSALSSSVAAVHDLPVPAGLSADLPLRQQVAALAGATARLQAELALRMAALERCGLPITDVRGEAVRAGLTPGAAGLLRAQGLFAADHPKVRAAWLAGGITSDHVDALRLGAVRLATPRLREQLVELVLSHLPGLDRRRARRLVAHTVDQLQPGDPDGAELSDHAARDLRWSRTPGGGVVFEGYLPTAEAAAFTSAIDALAASLHTEGDGLTPGQRNADALASLVAMAATNGLPTGGGLPAAMTLTVSLDEASRVALRDPAHFGTLYEARPKGGSNVGGAPAGDATVRFGVCCAAVTPVLIDPPAASSLLDRISRTGTSPLAVGRAVRLATPAQRQALRIRDDGCAIPGCCIPAPYAEPHHVVPWSLDGPTDLDNLVSLCWVHHRQTELGRFQFVRREAGRTRPPGALEHPLYWIITPTC